MAAAEGAEAAGCRPCPLLAWWAVSGSSQQPYPIHPVALTLPAAFSGRMVKLLPLPLEAILWPELAQLGLVVFEVGGSCGRQVLSQPYPMREKSLEG